ncbi:MAG TPA: DCC1-like thiol-disulfide oxidoreductase family protein [Chloroflexota bacterium]|jgi:predicted DCC family thiol-disulfide oxidoreductase YuxK
MHLILYDGLCGLCDRFNRFVLAHDSAERFQFASLQSPLGCSIAQRFGEDSGRLTTVLVVSDYDGAVPRLHVKGDAALVVLEGLGGHWRWAHVFRILPRGVVDWAYDLIAHNRYRLFGRYDACPLPDPRYRARFLDE